MVVRDRLKEMQEKSKYYKDGDTVEETELQPLKNKNKGMDFDEFLVIIEEVNQGIEEIKQNVDYMKRLQKMILTEPSKSEREKHQAKHGDLLSTNKGLGSKVQKLIKEQSERNNKLEKKGTLTSNEWSELRLKKTQVQTASNRFLDIWTEYNSLQVEFREKVKKELARNIKITNNNLSQDEIEEKIDKGDISIFSSGIIQETQAAKDQLVAIENRHQEILKLEAGIVEIHSMFIDLSNLVSMQGEMVDRIEDHINSAVIDVEKGREELAEAEKHKKSALKKKICLGTVLAVLALIILLIILSEFGAFSGGGNETVIRHEYVYNQPDGTQIVSDKELPDLMKPPPAPLTSPSPSTTPSPSTSSVFVPTDSTLSTRDDTNEVDYDLGPGK